MSKSSSRQVFNAISTKNLQRIFTALKLAPPEIFAEKDNEKDRSAPAITPKKADYIHKLNHMMDLAGVQDFVQRLKKTELEVLFSALSVNHGTNNPNSLTVLRKRLREFLMGEGVAEFLSESFGDNAKLLKVCLPPLNMEEIKNEDNEALVKRIAWVIQRNGTMAYAQSIPQTLLHKIVDQDLALLKTDYPTRMSLILAFVDNVEAREETAVPDTRIVFCETKPKLKADKDLSFEDINQWYCKDELEDYCRDNELLISGKKKELINRIIAWWGGDEETTKPHVTTEEERAEKAKKREEKKEKEKAKKLAKKEAAERRRSQSPAGKKKPAASRSPSPAPVEEESNKENATASASNKKSSSSSSKTSSKQATKQSTKKGDAARSPSPQARGRTVTAE